MHKKISLHELSRTDIRTLDKKNLANADAVPLDPSLPQEQRAAYLLEKLENPYCFRVGDISVKLEFTDSAPSLQDLLLSFLQRKKNGLQ